MRIALLLSGNLRTFDFSQESKISSYYKKLVEKYNLDVFCFTDDHNFFYNDIQHVKKTVNDDYDLGHGRLHPNHTFVSHEEACPIISTLLTECFGKYLKKYQIIPYYRFFAPFDIENKYHTSFYNDTCRPIHNKNNLLNNWYKVWKAYGLLQQYEKEHDITYDIIIKSRFDCIPYDILNSVDIRELDYTNTLICGLWDNVVMYDHGAIGNREIMHHYCSYYKNMSPNLVHNVRFYLNVRQSPIMGSYSYADGMNDISDSVEFGMTYLIQTMHGYKMEDHGINFRYLI